MPDIRLVALDLDGTLLNRQNRVAEEDAAAVREAAAGGVRIVLATSRWHHAAARTAAALGLDGLVISHNGALVRSSDGSRELLHHRIQMPLAHEIALHLDAVAGDGYVTVDDRTFIRSTRQRDPSRLAPEMATSASLAAVITAPPTAFLLFGRDSVRATVERFASYHGNELNLAEGVSDAFPDYLNVVHAQADKGAALARVAEALGLPLEATLAMGDAAPDIAMLRLAGVGIAMGNAAAVVKEAADDIAPRNDACGVAWALRKYVLAPSQS